MTHRAIQALRLDMDVEQGVFTVFAAVVADGDELILVDTGIPGQTERIRTALARLGYSLDRLTKIIITHQDRDHIGSLSELTAGTGGRIQVLAHETARPYLEGELPLVKSNTLATPVKVDVLLQDGEVLPVAGGLQVLYTPGHTPDHICLFHLPSRTLVSGDLLTAKDGELQSFDPKFTLDPEMARKSIGKLLELDIETVITYHGGVCTDRIRERLQSFLTQREADR
ncbi:MBL fold metallo-hydrolase [Gorillibacterium sp. sgz5001074]|uniref:MBL fold metallo-hydrolase n=1 Tax=Gorillibacterium sp. sgz5001074 TaxID=3446695 RepID=UPI003F6745BA